jgi:hypothetical protein
MTYIPRRTDVRASTAHLDSFPRMHRFSVPLSIAGVSAEGRDVTDGVPAIAQANVERSANVSRLMRAYLWSRVQERGSSD